MLHQIIIREHTSIQDIDSNWKLAADNEVVFEVQQSSSFQLLAEGAALGRLRDFELKHVRIKIKLPQLPLRSGKKDEIDENKLPPLLFTIFGLELLHLSISVMVHDGIDDKLLRSLIGSHIWDKVRSNKGAITSGKVNYLISRHGYEVPVALRDKSTTLAFPRFAPFQQNIRPYILELRGNTQASGTENDLIEWVFHNAENAFEHACEYLDGELSIPIHGYRGIILQKIIITNEEYKNRHDLPEIVMNFVTQQISEGDIDRKGLFSVVTVVDLGVGIQNTLPKDNEDLSSFERLKKAFNDGVTRKKTNDKEKAGFGLGQMANAARRLKALLFIISADEMAFYDFSDEDVKSIPNQELELITYGKIGSSSGLAISLIWAYNPGGNQIKLKAFE
jgi:hypothetical protein